MTWKIHLKRLAEDHKILGIKALRDATGMGIAEAKALVEALPKTVVVVHLGSPESLKHKFLEGGFDFRTTAHVQQSGTAA
jgi:ribosomal protein L7/L12